VHAQHSRLHGYFLGAPKNAVCGRGGSAVLGGVGVAVVHFVSQRFPALSPPVYLGLIGAALIVTQAGAWLRRAGQLAWLRGQALLPATSAALAPYDVISLPSAMSFG
jgi:hypothetical protein